MDPHRKRELLAGDAIDQCFEDGREARGLEPPHACGERGQQRVGRGHGGERREVDAQPEEPVQRAARERLRGLIDAPPASTIDRRGASGPATCVTDSATGAPSSDTTRS